MIHKLVQFALQQRFLVLMLTVLLIIAGVISSSACRWTHILTLLRPWSNSSLSGRDTPRKKLSVSSRFRWK